MSEEKFERIAQFPSGCSSPVRAEKNDSGSSRRSESPLHRDLDSRTERLRRSSWDDSDEDLEISDSKASRVNASEPTAVRGSISSELNELKEQFFQFLERENSIKGSFRIENLRERLEMDRKCDRRQSPARIRRRSRSSSSSSPVPEAESRNSPELREKASASEDLDDSDAFPKASEMDSRHYLDSFFSELRTKRISMLDPVPVAEKAEKESELLCDDMKLEMLSELSALEVNESGGYFCKTSRKLSQILEVEENRKDLERNSDEAEPGPVVLTKEIEIPEGNCHSPLPTARSKKNEKILENMRESMEKVEGNYKSLSTEDFGEILAIIGKPSGGSLSERSARIFDRKIDDDFIQLCAKTARTRLNSPKEAEGPGAEKPFHFLCLTGVLGANQEFSVAPLPGSGGKEAGNNSNEYLEIDLEQATMSGCPTPQKSTGRSEQSRRTRSGKSKSGSSPQSPKFALSIEKDSARSSGVEERGSRGCVESKMPSEEWSGRKSNRSSYRSNECLHLAINSPSVESAKSTSRSISDRGMSTNNSRSGRSAGRSERKRVSTGSGPASGTLGRVGNDSPLGSQRSVKKLSERSGSSTKSLKAPEESFLSCGRTPRSQEIPALELSFQTTERAGPEKNSCRSLTAAESANAVKERDRVSSGVLSARSTRSGRSRRSTARSTKRAITPRVNDSGSARSKGSAEKPRESGCEATYEGLSNQMPLSSSSSGSSWKEVELPSQEPSCRSLKPELTPENSGTRETFTPKLNDALEERLFSSRKSSSRSVVSSGRATVARTIENTSPSRSERIKSKSPSSLTSEEQKFTEVPDLEKLEVSSGRTTNRSLVLGDEEGFSQRSRNETDSDRHSNKRLSIINEASVEDFQMRGAFTENEEADVWKRSRPPSRRDGKRGSSRSAESEKTTEGPWTGSPPTKQSNTDGGTWIELIETFEGNSDSLLLSGEKFPGFPTQEENPFAGTSRGKHDDDDDDDDDDEDDSEGAEIPHVTERSAGRRRETPPAEINQILERTRDQKDFGVSFGLHHSGETSPETAWETWKASERCLRSSIPSLSAFRETFGGKMKNEEEKGVRSVQNLYFVEVDKGGRFGMGESGDMTCWSAGESDKEDPDTPRDHGDGAKAFKSSEVIPKAEKREKDTKIQRQLWTELKEDFRQSEAFSSLFPGTEANVRFAGSIPVGLKTSKSDNWIDQKIREAVECQNSAISDFLCKYTERENAGSEALCCSREMGADPPEPEGARACSSSGSEDSGREEFECEITPRLSRSMSDVQTQLRADRYKGDESKGTSECSSGRLLENFRLRGEGESVGMYLTRGKDANAVGEPENWLILSNHGSGSRSGNRSGKGTKRGRKLNKSSGSSGEQLVQYLNSGKSRSSVPSLKLRKSNCFQNFYKRFISVFCVTSNSSAATSK